MLVNEVLAPIRAKSGPRYWKQQAKKLPKEQRQEILTAIRAGESFGHLEKKFGVEWTTVYGVLLINQVVNKWTRINTETV